MPEGASQQFVVKGLDADGKLIPGASVSFRVDGAPGTVTKSGRFDANGPGSGSVLIEVSFRGKTLAAAAPVVVLDRSSGVVLASLTVSPLQVEVEVGESVEFDAVATDSSGERVTAGIDYTWGETGSVGSVDPQGVFTATAPGQGWVEVTGSLFGSGARGQAKVIVREPAPPSGSTAGQLSPGFTGGIAAVMVIGLMAALWMVFLGWRRRTDRPGEKKLAAETPKPELIAIELPPIAAKAVPKLKSGPAGSTGGAARPPAEFDLPLLPFDETPTRRSHPRA